MLNATVYEETLHTLWQEGTIALVDNKPTKCSSLGNCKKCDLYHMSGTCSHRLVQWLISEYIPQDCDWSKVPVDAKIRVKIHDVWYNAHFAKYDSDLHVVCFWHKGKTSFTSNQYSYDYVEQAYAELLEPLED